MQRFDFSSVFTIIRDGLSVGCDLTQVELIETMFSAAIYGGEDVLNLEPGNVSLWISGQRSVSPSIAKFYFADKNFICLKNDIQEQVLHLLYDSDKTIEKLHDLLMQDPAVSDYKKQILGAGYPFHDDDARAYFLAGAVAFSLQIPFVSHSQKLAVPVDGRSPVLKDFLLTNKPPRPCAYFCGRDAELDELHTLLQEHHKVFLHGIPGIGKSEVAKAYAQQHKKDYTNIIYLRYTGNLQYDLTYIEFVNDILTGSDDFRFRAHVRFLNTLKEDTLLIIDNFDISADQESALEILFDFKCSILFTTRYRFDDYTQLELKEIPSSEAQLQLYRSLYPDTDRYLSVVEQIIDTVHGHTFAMELSARLLKNGILTPEQLLDKLKEEHTQLNATDQIRTYKDKARQKATYREHIHTLFALYHLSKQEQYVMRNMVLMPLGGIYDKIVAKWTALPDMNTIHDLIEKGFIHPDDDHMIQLHPMIWDVVNGELKPSVKNCRTLVETIHKLSLLTEAHLPYARQVIQIGECILRNIQNDEPDYYINFLQDLLFYLEKYQCLAAIDLTKEQMHQLVEEQQAGSNINKAFLYYSETIDHPLDFEKNNELLRKAMETLGPVTAENVNEACMFLCNLSNNCCSTKQYAQALIYSKTCLDHLQHFPLDSISDRLRYYEQYALSLAYNKRIAEAESVLKSTEATLHSYYGENSEAYALFLMTAGHINYLKEDWAKAKQQYQQSFAISKAIHADDPDLLSTWEALEKDTMSLFILC